MTNMSINHKRQSQFELFPKASQNNPETGKAAYLTKDLTLSLENIIVLYIIFVMTLVLFFSFGVEKGKRVAKSSSVVEHSNSIQVAEISSGKKSSGLVEAVQNEEGIIPSVKAPVGLTEEAEPVFLPTFEESDGQEEFFTIQVASFKLEKNALKEADRLKNVGHDDAFVMPKGSYSIVCVGKFAKKNEAKKFSNRLQSKYNDCLVRRL